MKAVLTEKFIAQSAYIKNLKKSHTNDWIAHLKALEHKESNSLRRSIWQEIIKVRAEINKIERRRTIQILTKKFIFWENQQNKQTLMQINQKSEIDYPN